MKRFLIFVFVVATSVVTICCNSKPDYNPDTQLTPTQKDAIMTAIVRYTSKKPEQATETDKFDPKYDSFYRATTSKMKFEQYVAKGDDFYFLISQPAPSLVEKRNATGGRFRLNDSGEMIEYEEIFRTWKMVPDTLRRRSYFLFDKMVNGESLEPWLTKNSNDVEYIEFPDDRTYFDVKGRKWEAK